MLKLIGTALILSVSFYIGTALSLEGTRRVKQNAAFCRLLSAVCEDISALRRPITSVICEHADETLEACGFLPMARARISCGTVHDILGEVIRALHDEGRLALSEEEMALLCAYSKDAGTSDAESEVRRCTYYLQKLAAIGAVTAEEAPKKAKIYRAAAFAFGALCVLGLL